MSNEPTPPGMPPFRTNKLAVTSLVLGILSILLCVVGIVFAIPGLICGIMGMSRVKKSAGTEKGHGLAVTGTVLSGLAIVLAPILGLLAAIAVPNFVKAREASQRSACVANLRQIDGAKTAWALENKKLQTDTPEETDLFGADKYIRQKPTCPKGGDYSINPVDTQPTCTEAGHYL
jgi:competence protein ComGC